ncbi:nucleotidyltransferase family protein [Nitrospinae bacterium]|jgi:D-glycero-alpha-D-manno-heptose 1-phosphate guanylyltransferase|nr:nucleotidyltransferase family protein [Nitrospinota bacterium]
MEAIVLAGGLGTRLREAVADVPKPMAPISERPFLEYLLNYWIGQGVDRFILSVGYKWKIIQNHFGSIYKSAAIEYSIENTPLGTGGGILLAIKQLTEKQPCLLLNGDTFFKVPLADFLKFHNQNAAEISLALRQISGANRYDWVILNNDNSVEAFEPRSQELKSGQINGGVYLLNPKIFKGLTWDGSSKLSLEDDIIPQALNANRQLKGFICAEKFIDIGIPEDYQAAAAFFEN